MQHYECKREWFTIPNLLSLFRLCLIPVYVQIYLNAENWKDNLLAASILGVSCLTDLLDGIIARKFNMASTVGKILDPLADKVTQFVLMLCLVKKYTELLLLIGLFILKELFQLIAGLVRWHQGKVLKTALISGKISTTILFGSLILMVLLPYLSSEYLSVLILLNWICVLVSFLDYICTYLFLEQRFEVLNR